MENARYLLPKSVGYFRATFALVLIGVITFVNLHMMQPLLPLFAEEFDVTPKTTGLLLSLPMMAMVVSLLASGPLSDLTGRKIMMSIGLLMVFVTTIYPIFVSSFSGLLAARILQGLFLGALPPAVMAYLNEEYDKHHMAGVMAIYIAGTALGGMSGRIVSGFIANTLSWQGVFLLFSIINFLVWASFLVMLPPSRHFVKKKQNVREEMGWMRRHITNPLLTYDFVIGAVLQFSFYGIFTFLTFRLSGPPYDLSVAQIGYFYLVYLTGILFSPYFGTWVRKWGLLNLFRIGAGLSITGLIISGFQGIPWIAIGLLLFAAGHFINHSAGSSWVGSKVKEGRGAANSLYLVSYYTGGSLGAYVLGWVWERWAWIGVELAAVFFIAAVPVCCHLLQKADMRDVGQGHSMLKGG